ncbi:DC1, C1-like, Rho-associated protein kinase 1/2 [Artemisia annua]|uniref:DC1, C1-like, Rho-associated protein kinase 1/2 n=1 Tax=Artemisia annua TaxID=35608 RepID=A0A2U1L520_ARTAN|nr:DC1, C1-like, Rho-associated protein kinase 1/2 [Artemisia annua]
MASSSNPNHQSSLKVEKPDIVHVATTNTNKRKGSWKGKGSSGDNSTPNKVQKTGSNNPCALHFPKTIRHKLDKHPLKLSYIPIENHKGEYFCEVCEEGLNPKKWFYHCSEYYAQSIHSDCAPLILKSEQGVNFVQEGVYKFLNMKLGGITKMKLFHLHSLSFVVGTESDGNCLCGLHARLIFKCLQCKYAIHVTCWTSYLDYEIELRGVFKKPKLPIKLYHPSKVTRPVTK